jgi:hypothetical protein
LNDALGSGKSIALSQQVTPSATQALVTVAASANGVTPILSLNINLTRLNADGTNTAVHQLSGNVQVVISLTDAQVAAITDVSNAKVFYYDSDSGSLTDMGATFDLTAKTVTFTTKHFSTYVIAQTTATANPKTSGNSAPILSLALLGAGAAAIIVKQRTKFRIKKNGHQVL